MLDTIGQMNDRRDLNISFAAAEPRGHLQIRKRYSKYNQCFQNGDKSGK